MFDSPFKTSTVDELLFLEDIHFIRAAYWHVLDREADAKGIQHYLTKLRNGLSKIEILAQLRFSDEGKQKTISLTGLEDLLQKHQKQTHDWMKKFFNFFHRKKSTAISRQLNAIQRTVSDLSHLTSNVRNLVLKQNVEIEIASPTEASITLQDLSPRARAIYFQLKSAAAHYRRNQACK